MAKKIGIILVLCGILSYILIPYKNNPEGVCITGCLKGIPYKNNPEGVCVTGCLKGIPYKNHPEGVCITGIPERAAQNYLQKIWISEDGNESAFTKVSFLISEIGEQEIKGIFSVQGNPSDYREEGTFCGYREGSKADCFFTDRDGDSGSLRLILIGKDRIEATIKYANDTSYLKKEELSGVSIYRPYHITDVGGDTAHFEINERLSLEVQLDNWGEVQIMPGLFDTGNKKYPIVFLTDKAGNILYEMPFWSQVGTEVGDIVVKDINNDGRKDIEITTYFTTDPQGEEMPVIIRSYYQWEDGLFYEEACEIPE